jgi:hypothetical protein
MVGDILSYEVSKAEYRPNLCHEWYLRHRDQLYPPCLGNLGLLWFQLLYRCTFKTDMARACMTSSWFWLGNANNAHTYKALNNRVDTIL